MTGEIPSVDVLVELAAELLVVDKLVVLASRQVHSIREARDCWMIAFTCYKQSLDLWSRLPNDDRLRGHHRLLERLLRSAEERIDFHSVSASDREQYFTRQRDRDLDAERISSNGEHQREAFV